MALKLSFLYGIRWQEWWRLLRQTRFDIDVGDGTTPFSLPALQSAGNAKFDVSAARVVELNALVSHDRSGYTLGDNATVTANALTSLTNATITLGAGSTFTAISGDDPPTLG